MSPLSAPSPVLSPSPSIRGAPGVGAGVPVFALPRRPPRLRWTYLGRPRARTLGQRQSPASVGSRIPRGRTNHRLVGLRLLLAEDAPGSCPRRALRIPATTGPVPRPGPLGYSLGRTGPRTELPGRRNDGRSPDLLLAPERNRSHDHAPWLGAIHPGRRHSSRDRAIGPKPYLVSSGDIPGHWPRRRAPLSRRVLSLRDRGEA
jgi:hypothetical protein